MDKRHNTTACPSPGASHRGAPTFSRTRLKAPIPVGGFQAKDYTLNAIAKRIKGGYTGVEAKVEMEAYTFAETNSLLGAVKVVEKFCH